MINFIQKHKYAIALGVFILIYIAYFTLASFLRYNNFFTGRFDLGNMDQTIWNTIHDRIFQITDPNGTANISRLAFHADFILILISPLYLIWSNPQMLLLLQTVVLGLGAVFVFLIADYLLRNKNLALTFSAIYLLNPSLQFTNLYDFHAIVLGTTLLLATFYFFLKKNYLLFLLFAILSGLTKEEVWAITALFGLAIIARTIFEKKFRLNFSEKQLLEIGFGLVVFLSSTLICYLLIWVIIPYVKGSGHFALAYYSDFGGTASSISKNILFSPIKTISIILQPQKVQYLVELLLPFGLMSLLAPFYLIFAAPDLVINLLSGNAQLHQIYYQYTAAITPFLAVSAIYAVLILKKKLPKINNRLIITYLVGFALISAYLYGPLPGTIHANVAMFKDQLSNRQIIDDFLSQIPTRYSIAASNNLGSHLSHRRNIYTIPVGIGQADVILFLLNDNFAQPSLTTQKAMVKQMSNDKNYIQVYENGDFVAFEKRSLYTQAAPKPKKGQVSLFPYSITALSNRNYQKSDISIEREVTSAGNFKSYIISYLSDGLKEYSLMNIPTSEMPIGGYSVVIINHGFVEPKSYSTIDSYKSITDYFSTKGYLVLKPDYRGNGNSETGDTVLMRFAYPVDVLNLIESLKNIPQANPNQIYLYGHSMGGEITLKVLEIAGKHPEILARIRAAVVWAPVTDLVDWFSSSHVPWLQETKNDKDYYAETFKVMGTPEKNPLLWQSVSPINYLSDIQTPIQINHGLIDSTVSYRTSIELYDNLISLNKTADLLTYPGNDHNLTQSWDKAAVNALSFFKSY
ncbi:MAG TPA: alpha/beta fold hydrolase [Patescibacteria group bacterium]|nr:alpha/beta fold hydrolase [Patescibacteria group bacterium]